MKIQNNAEVKASSPIRTSLYEREVSMWGSLKRPSPRPTLFEECRSDDSDLCHELTDRYGFTPEEMHRAAERYHLDFRVSSLLEDNATPAQKSAEIDLADFLFT